MDDNHCITHPAKSPMMVSPSPLHGAVGGGGDGCLCWQHDRSSASVHVSVADFPDPAVPSGLV